jgi:protein-tyrosine phosphatase
VRDLGGLRTQDGRTTSWAAIVRADDLDRLTDTGWSALDSHGVRTIVDLRNDEKRGPWPTLRPTSARPALATTNFAAVRARLLA